MSATPSVENPQIFHWKMPFALFRSGSGVSKSCFRSDSQPILIRFVPLAAQALHLPPVAPQGVESIRQSHIMIRLVAASVIL